MIAMRSGRSRSWLAWLVEGVDLVGAGGDVVGDHRALGPVPEPGEAAAAGVAGRGDRDAAVERRRQRRRLAVAGDPGHGRGLPVEVELVGARRVVLDRVDDAADPPGPAHQRAAVELVDARL